MCNEPAAHANKQRLTEALINMQNTKQLSLDWVYESIDSIFFVPNAKTTH